MKWPVYLHSPTATLGAKLSPQLKLIYKILIDEIKSYLNAFSLREDLMKDFLNSWNELTTENCIPVLKDVMKWIRHRLLDSTPLTFHRLIHLVNAMMRQCGIVAQVLIGREQFLRTLIYLIPQHSKSKDPLAKETATFLYLCIKSWATAVMERKDLFPYLEKVVQKLKKIKKTLKFADMSKFKITNLEKTPVRLDKEFACSNVNEVAAVDDTAEKRKSEVSTDSEKRPSSIHSGNQIEVGEEDKSVSIVSGSIDTPPAYRARPLPPIPGSVAVVVAPPQQKRVSFNNKNIASTSGSRSQLMVIVEKEDEEDTEQDSDISTAYERYKEEEEEIEIREESDEIGESMDEVEIFVRQRNSLSTIQSAKTFYFDKVYDKMKSSKFKDPMSKSKSGNGVVWCKSNSGSGWVKAESAASGSDWLTANSQDQETPKSPKSKRSADVTVKYYGTQRIVKYKSSDLEQAAP